MPEEFGVVLILMIIFSVPVIAMLLGHQQKMAKLMREDRDAANTNNQTPVLHHALQSLTARLDSIEQKLDAQSIAIDDLQSNQRPTADMHQRLGQGD